MNTIDIAGRAAGPLQLGCPSTESTRCTPHHRIIGEPGLRFGRAIDAYTIGSTLMDGKTFENEYSELGGLVHQLKYGNPDGEAFERLVDEILHIALPTLDSLGFLKVPRLAVVPMPSTTEREFDLVARLAQKIAARFDLPYRDDILIKNSGVHAKHLELGSEFADGDFESIPFSKATPATDSQDPIPLLIIDDVYGEGRSLRACLRALSHAGHDGRIYFLSMVYTRNHGLARQRWKEAA